MCFFLQEKIAVGSVKFNYPINLCEADYIIKGILSQARKSFLVNTFSAISLFPGRKGALSVRSVQEIVKKAGMRAGIKKNVHPHIFRHSFTTHVLESGLDIVSAQSLLGHSSPETTLGYSHALRPKMIAIVSPLDDLK